MYTYIKISKDTGTNKYVITINLRRTQREIGITHPETIICTKKIAKVFVSLDRYEHKSIVFLVNIRSFRELASAATYCTAVLSRRVFMSYNILCPTISADNWGILYSVIDLGPSPQDHCGLNSKSRDLDRVSLVSRSRASPCATMKYP